MNGINKNLRKEVNEENKKALKRFGSSLLKLLQTYYLLKYLFLKSKINKRIMIRG